MKWSSHRTLTLRALAQARKLGITFPEELIQGLLKGVVEPDEKPDFRYVTVVRYRRRRAYTYTIEKRVPHHDVIGTVSDDVMRNDLIRYYVCLASYLYRQGQYYDSGRALGRAIHYIQDSVIPHTEEHEKVENDIEKCLKQKICSKDIVRIIEEAYNKTFKILKSFYEIVSTELTDEQIKLFRSKIRRIKLLKAALCIVPLLTIFLISLALNIFFIFLLYLILAEPQIVMAVISWTPKTYWEAFRLGILRLKLKNYRTVM